MQLRGKKKVILQHFYTNIYAQKHNEMWQNQTKCDHWPAAWRRKVTYRAEIQQIAQFFIRP